MGSQLDLDQGGTFRQYAKVWQGPSVGWVQVPVQAILDITAAGTYPIQRWTNVIRIKAAAGVINLNLPSSKASPVGPQAIPNQWVYNPVIIMDVAGQCSLAVTCNVNPNGAELISGLGSIALAAPYGTLLLEPLLDTGGWNLGQ